MGRKRVCEQIIATLKSSLASGEHVLSCGSVWATEYGGRLPLRFGDRSLLYVAVTDQRLIFVRAPRRRRPITADSIVIAKRHAALTLHIEVVAVEEKPIGTALPPRLVEVLVLNDINLKLG